MAFTREAIELLADCIAATRWSFSKGASTAPFEHPPEIGLRRQAGARNAVALTRSPRIFNSMPAGR